MLVTRGEYNTNITTFILDNSNREISEEDVRDRFLEAKDSFISMESGFDILDYNPVTVYQIGDAVTYINLIYRKILTPNVGVDPTDVLEWELLSETPFSNESKWGIVKKATFIDFTGGTNDDKYVTPFQIASLNIPQYLDDLLDVDLAVTPTQGQSLFYDSLSLNFIASDILTIFPLSSYLSFDPTTRVLSFDDSNLVQSLDDLSDVVLTAPTDGQALIYNFSTSKWENQNLFSFTDGSVLFADSIGNITEDNTGLHFINSSNNFGIGIIPTNNGENTLSILNGVAPTSTGANNSVLYSKDFPLVSNSSSPYFLTENGKDISLMESWLSKLYFEFHTSIDTVKYKSFVGAVFFWKELYSTDQIDNIVYSYRMITTPTSYSDPFITPSSGTLSDLNGVVSLFLPTDKWELQISVTPNPLWFGLFGVTWKYEPEINE